MSCRPLTWRLDEDLAEKEGWGRGNGEESQQVGARGGGVTLWGGGGGGWDVIVGSDLIYSRASVPALVATVERKLRRGGRFILLFPDGRSGVLQLSVAAV